MSEIFFTKRGNGHPIILLHGFPFHHRIWDGFAEKLSKKFKVYTPDLPGFGKSPGIKSPFTIDQVGDLIASWIEDEQIKNSILIGHSLGGYVALAVAGKRPDLLAGLGLFHSTASPDSSEKKESRNKVIEFINKNGVEAFTSNFIAPLYFNPQHPSIPKVREIATHASADAVKGYTLAMRDRDDKASLLKSFPKAILFITGETDAGIPVESIVQQASFSSRSKTYILPQVGHMGMFEAEEKTLKIIEDFAEKNIVTN